MMIFQTKIQKKKILEKKKKVAVNELNILYNYDYI